ncbi:hypothetical protein EST38_g11718 [Candolleomyces aberdarensis]|uniref:Nucleoplasmin-like domain-containing protein n=1 Tax=Candolleomyces aberdarensis TaxID=2316362 RepID=A0A4Q2D460_9AGAR|nr:hypothetical protein EST38_g11718 [Candolleomyces aberdarensis]
MANVSAGGIWILNLPGGASWRFTPSAPIRVTNACLGYKLDGPGERACLEYYTEPSGKPTAIACFTRHACERGELELDLEVGETYVFTAIGPFQIDLMGFYLYEEPQVGDDTKDDVGVANTAKKRARGKAGAKKPPASEKQPPVAGGKASQSDRAPSASSAPVAFPALSKAHPVSSATAGPAPRGGPVTRRRSRSAVPSEGDLQGNGQEGFFYNKGKEKA